MLSLCCCCSKENHEWSLDLNQVQIIAFIFFIADISNEIISGVGSGQKCLVDSQKGEEEKVLRHKNVSNVLFQFWLSLSTSFVYSAMYWT